MKITVVSGMARNRGDSRKVEVEPELLACDLIKRVCVLMNIQSEPRMYLRLPDSSEVGGEDVVGSFVREDCFLTLDTRSVSVIQWSVAIASVFIGFTLAVVGFGMYLPEKKLSTTAFIFLITFGFVMLILSSGAVVFFHRKHSNRTLKRASPSI